MALAFIPLYIKYLGIEAYGLIGLYSVLQAWMILLDMGGSQALSREMSRFTVGIHTAESIRAILRSIEFFLLIISIIAVIGLYLCSSWLAEEWLSSKELSIDQVSNALSLIAIVIGLRIVEGLYRNSLLGLQRQVWYNAAHAIISSLRFGGAVGVLALVSPTIEAFFIWQVVISLLAVVVFRRKTYDCLPKSHTTIRPSVGALAPIVTFAGGLFGINLLAVMLTQIDKIILSRLLSLESFGYYMLAATLAGGVTLVIGPITQALYPKLVQLYTIRDEQSFARLFHQGAQLVTLASAPVMLTMAFFPSGVIYA